jgi:hypothetical protein
MDEVSKWDLIEDFRSSSFREAANSGTVEVWLMVGGEWRDPISCSRFGAEWNGPARNLLAIVGVIKARRLEAQRGISDVGAVAQEVLRALPAPQDAYHVLGLTSAATWAEVESAWRRIAASRHPDNRQTGNADEFKRAAAAMEELRKRFVGDGMGAAR